jgi:hypothetical protein
MHVSEEIDGIHVRITMRFPHHLKPCRLSCRRRYIVNLYYDIISNGTIKQALSRGERIALIWRKYFGNLHHALQGKMMVE